MGKKRGRDPYDDRKRAPKKELPPPKPPLIAPDYMPEARVKLLQERERRAREYRRWWLNRDDRE